MISEDIQKLETPALVELYEIDLSPIGVNQTYRFHNGINELGNDIVWNGNTYMRFPILASGFEKRGSGTLPRPKVVVSNVNGLLGAVLKANRDLVGAKFTRIRTFSKYLDTVNFASGNPTADPNAKLKDEVFTIDRKATENRQIIEFELASRLDVSNVKLPRRQFIANICMHEYRGELCGYAASVYFTENDVSTPDPNKDTCGKRLSSCRKRFGANSALPYGGFPSCGLTTGAI